MKTLFFLLITLSLSAQKKMVLIEGFQGHEIEVPDSVANASVKEFYWYANKSRVDYETNLHFLKSVIVVDMNKSKMYYYDKGVIYLNSYLNDYPNFKRVVIFHAILHHVYGVPKTKGKSLDVMNEHFYVDDWSEGKYKNRRTRKTDIKDAMAEFEIHKPLNTKN